MQPTVFKADCTLEETIMDSKLFSIYEKMAEKRNICCFLATVSTTFLLEAAWKSQTYNSQPLLKQIFLLNSLTFSNF